MSENFLLAHEIIKAQIITNLANMKVQSRGEGKCNGEWEKYRFALFYGLMFFRQLKSLKKPEHNLSVLEMIGVVFGAEVGDQGLEGLIEQLIRKYSLNDDEEGLLLAHEIILDQIVENTKDLLQGKKVISGCKCDSKKCFYVLKENLIFLRSLEPLRPDHAQAVLEGLENLEKSDLSLGVLDGLINQLIEKYSQEAGVEIASVADEKQAVETSAG